MNIKCIFGFHDWSADCEKCSKCGKTRENQQNEIRTCIKEKIIHWIGPSNVFSIPVKDFTDLGEKAIPVIIEILNNPIHDKEFSSDNYYLPVLVRALIIFSERGNEIALKALNDIKERKIILWGRYRNEAFECVFRDEPEQFYTEFEEESAELEKLFQELLSLGKANEFMGSPGAEGFNMVGYLKRAVEIGERLDSIGGLNLMLSFYKRMDKIRHNLAHELEIVWNGIGQWQS